MKKLLNEIYFIVSDTQYITFFYKYNDLCLNIDQ